jgi:hypothetical protein
MPDEDRSAGGERPDSPVTAPRQFQSSAVLPVRICKLLSTAGIHAVIVARARAKVGSFFRAAARAGWKVGSFLRAVARAGLEKWARSFESLPTRRPTGPGFRVTMRSWPVFPSRSQIRFGSRDFYFAPPAAVRPDTQWQTRLRSRNRPARGKSRAPSPGRIHPCRGP